MPVPSSLTLMPAPSGSLWPPLSSLFLLLQGLRFALGVCLAWRKAPSPWEAPQACAQTRAQHCHLLTAPAVPLVSLPSTLHPLVGSLYLGALETLCNSSVYQLLVPKGPTDWNHSCLWASGSFHGPGVGPWLLMVWAAFRQGLVVRWHETYWAWAWLSCRAVCPAVRGLATLGPGLFQSNGSPSPC